MSPAHHDFDGEPATELPADEPRTPGWVPALGLGLFVLVGGVLLVREGGPPSPATPAVTAQTAAEAVPPAPARPVPPPQGASTAPPRTSAVGARPQLTPEAARELQKKIDEARKRRAEAGAATAPATPPPPAR